MPDAPEPTPSRTSSIQRRLANLFIALFLAYQVAMPLRYYLGGRGYDERFSWRMFSSLRMQKCDVRIDDIAAGRQSPVKVQSDVQVAWVKLLERVRMPVVEKYLARRCEGSGIDEVSYTRSCIETSGASLPARTLRMHCSDRSLHGVEP